MRLSVKPLFGIVVGAVVVSLLSPQAVASDAQWIEIRSPHFAVTTDAGERRGQEVAVRFEQMRAVFGSLVVNANVKLPVPLKIVAFRNTRELLKCAPLWRGRPIHVAGLFQSGQDVNYILLDMSVEDPWRTVFHEYAHLLLNGNWPGQTQPWFDEGFAEFFSTIEMDSREARVGRKPPAGDVEVLQQLGQMKIADLFRVRQDAKTYNEGERRSQFYAESWLVVHYLYDHDLISRVPKYFDAVFNKHVEVADAIQQQFGMTPAAFDRAMNNYLFGRVAYVTVPTPSGIETRGYSITPLSRADAKAVMADVHLHTADYRAQGVEEFQEILKTQPGNVAALSGLGYASLQKRDFEVAEQYFRKALSGKAKDARVYYYAALLENQRGHWQQDPKKIALIRQYLLTTIEMSPEFADAYSLLALNYTVSSEPEEATPAMITAVELNPRNEEYKLNLSLLYMHARRMEEAIALLRELLNSSDPRIVERARESLMEAQSTQSTEKPPAIISPPVCLAA